MEVNSSSEVREWGRCRRPNSEVIRDGSNSELGRPSLVGVMVVSSG